MRRSHGGSGDPAFAIGVILAVVICAVLGQIIRLIVKLIAGAWRMWRRGNLPRDGGTATPATGEPNSPKSGQGGVIVRKPDGSVYTFYPTQKLRDCLAAMKRGDQRRRDALARHDRFWNEQLYHRTAK